MLSAWLGVALCYTSNTRDSPRVRLVRAEPEARPDHAPVDGQASFVEETSEYHSAEQAQVVAEAESGLRLISGSSAASSRSSAASSRSSAAAFRPTCPPFQTVEYTTARGTRNIFTLKSREDGGFFRSMGPNEHDPYAEIWIATHSSPTQPSSGEFLVKIILPKNDRSCRTASGNSSGYSPQCKWTARWLLAESQGCMISQQLKKKAKATFERNQGVITSVDPVVFNKCIFDGAMIPGQHFLIMDMIGSADPESNDHYSRWQTLEDASAEINAKALQEENSIRHLQSYVHDEYGMLCPDFVEISLHRPTQCSRGDSPFQGARLRLKIIERLIEAVYVMSEFRGLDDTEFGAYIHRRLDMRTIMVNINGIFQAKGRNKFYVGVVLMDFSFAQMLAPRHGQLGPNSGGVDHVLKCFAVKGNGRLQGGPLWVQPSNDNELHDVVDEDKSDAAKTAMETPWSYWDAVKVVQDDQALYPWYARPMNYIGCPYHDEEAAELPPEVWSTYGDRYPVEAQICDDTVTPASRGKSGSGSYGHGGSGDMWSIGVIDFLMQGGSHEMIEHMLQQAYPEREDYPRHEGGNLTQEEFEELRSKRERNPEASQNVFNYWYSHPCAWDEDGVRHLPGCPKPYLVNVNAWPIVNHRFTIEYSEAFEARYLLARRACDRPRPSTMMIMLQCVLNRDCKYSQALFYAGS